MLLNVDDYRRRARRRLPRFVFDYVDGAAEDGVCMDRNRAAFDRAALVPECLRDTRTLSTSIEVFGHSWKQPFAVAPMGMNGLVRSGGDLLLAHAAAAKGIPFVLSTASNERLERVAEAMVLTGVTSVTEFHPSMVSASPPAQLHALARDLSLEHGEEDQIMPSDLMRSMSSVE